MDGTMRTSKITVLLTLVLALATPAMAQQWQSATGPTGWLGITLEPTWTLDGGRCQPAVMVTRVMRGAPADRAGLRQGDLLLRVNGRHAMDEGLAWMANRLAPGDTVRLTVLRDEQEREFRAIAGQRPQGMPLVTARVNEAPNAVMFGPQPSRVFRTGHDSIIVCSGDLTSALLPHAGVQVAVSAARVDSLRQEIARHVLRARVAADSVFIDTVSRSYIVRVAPGGGALVVAGSTVTPFVSPKDLGVGSRAVAGAEFTPLNQDLARYFHGAHQGLLVIQVVPGTPAARAGLRAGDVITRAGDEAIASIADLRRIVAFGPRPVALHIVRAGQHRVLSLPRD